MYFRAPFFVLIPHKYIQSQVYTMFHWKNILRAIAKPTTYVRV